MKLKDTAAENANQHRPDQRMRLLTKHRGTTQQDDNRRTKTRDPFYASKAWYRIRQKVLTRDKYRCQNCQAYVRGKGLARVDHIIPRTKAPQLAVDPQNLRTLCVPCDNARHQQDRHGQKDRHGAGDVIGPDGFPVGGAWNED